MLTSIVPESLTQLQNFVRVGCVEEVISTSQIKVVLVEESHRVEVMTCFAMGNQPLPKAGDKVLIAGESVETGFIIGLFPSIKEPKQSYTLEQDNKTGKTILSVPEGDLSLRAEQGSIHLDAAKEITLNCPQFGLDTAKGNIKITDASYQGLRLGATIERTKLFLGKLNSTVGRIIERAKNVYRQVDNLNQVKAGRMRTLVTNSYHLKGERIIEKAEKEVRIDGEKINLG